MFKGKKKKGKNEKTKKNSLDLHIAFAIVLETSKHNQLVSHSTKWVIPQGKKRVCMPCSCHQKILYIVSKPRDALALLKLINIINHNLVPISQQKKKGIYFNLTEIHIFFPLYYIIFVD